MKRNWVREEDATPGVEERNGKEEVSNLVGANPSCYHKNEVGWRGGTNGKIR